MHSSSAPRRPPRAPWGQFPLSELCILLGLIALIAGIIPWNRQGAMLSVCGLVLACLGGGEIALREHLAGHRSHTGLLAGAAALAVLAALALVHAPAAAALGAAMAVYTAVALWLRRAFRREA
jgi:hypothetical protein